MNACFLDRLLSNTFGLPYEEISEFVKSFKTQHLIVIGTFEATFGFDKFSLTVDRNIDYTD